VRRTLSAIRIVAAIWCAVSSVACPAQARTSPEGGVAAELELLKEGTRPLVSVTFASADRFVAEADYIFKAAGSPDSYKVVEDWLKTTMNSLEGFNREKPFGLMVYLPAIFPPIPEVVAFVPVDSIDDAQKLVEKAPVVIRKDSKVDGRYEIIGPRQTVPMLLRGGYAFFPLGGKSDAKVLDRELPEPAQLVASQSRQFDISVTLDIASIPVGTRTLLTNVLTSGISTQLQQRDDEPEGAWRMRKAEGERGLASLRQLLDECQRMILGLDVVQEEHAVNIDLVLEAVPGSKLLQEIVGASSKPSYYIPLLDDSAAVSVSMSGDMNERDRKAWVEILEGFKAELIRRISERQPGAAVDDAGPPALAVAALQKTVELGHIDVFTQFYRDPADKLAIVGAIRVEDGDVVAAGVLDVLSRFSDDDEIREVGEITIGSFEHQGVLFHRFTLKEPPMEAVDVFGRSVGVTVGCSGRSLWFCLGGEDSGGSLRMVMDQLEKSLQQPQERRTISSARAVINVNQLVEIQQRVATSSRAEAGSAEKESSSADGSAASQNSVGDGENVRPQAAVGSEDRGEDGGERRRGRRRFEARRAEAGRIFRDTMAEGDDRIVMDFRPSETGGRFRIRLEEGFVRILGRIWAARLAAVDASADQAGAPSDSR